MAERGTHTVRLFQSTSYIFSFYLPISLLILTLLLPSMRNPFRPTPAPPGFARGKPLPETNAGYVTTTSSAIFGAKHVMPALVKFAACWHHLLPSRRCARRPSDTLTRSLTYRPLSRLLFSWLDPFLSVGFSRPLEKEGVSPEMPT